jgi:F-type H+-transporting ATPase subunit b
MMMNALLPLADTSGGGQLEEIGRTFGVDWPHLIAQIISFCVVCALLYRFAYRPVLAMLEERRRRIAEGLASAEKSNAELARIEARQREILEQADAQAAKLIEEARAAATRVQEQETQKAIAAAKQIVANASEAVGASQAPQPYSEANMDNTLRLEIVTPEATVYSENVDIVTLPAVEGQIGILPQHVPLNWDCRCHDRSKRKKRLQSSACFKIIFCTPDTTNTAGICGNCSVGHVAIIWASSDVWEELALVDCALLRTRKVVYI